MRGMTTRKRIEQNIEIARAELARLRTARLELADDDSAGAVDVRRLAVATQSDLASLQADLRAIEELESRPRRQQEAEKKREELRCCLERVDEVHQQWVRLDALLAEAVAVAGEINAAGLDVVSRLRKVTSGDSFTFDQHVCANATGSAGRFTQALAVRIRALVEAMPGGYRLTSDYFHINPMTSWKGASLERAIAAAREDLHRRINEERPKPPPEPAAEPSDAAQGGSSDVA